MKTIKIKTFLIVMATLFFSCNATKTAVYDQYSYQKTTELKVETANLLDKATTPFTDHKLEVENLILDVAKITEYEKNKPNNEITYAMWKIFSDKEKNLLAGFIKRWEDKKMLSEVFLTESKKQILDAMDLLIQYEIKKDKTSQNNLLNLINKNQ